MPPISCLLVLALAQHDERGSTRFSSLFVILFFIQFCLILFFCSSFIVFFLLHSFFVELLFSQSVFQVDDWFPNTQNENRMALISALDETSSLFTGTGKISTLGSLHRGESLVSDVSASLCSKCSKVGKRIWKMKRHISVGRRLSRGSVNFLLPVRQHRRGGASLNLKHSYILFIISHWISNFSDHIALCRVQTKIIRIKANPHFVCR